MICCSQRKMTVILNTRENQGGIVNSDSIQAHYFHEHQTEREGERERGRERLRMNTCKLPKLPWKLQEEPEEQWRSQPKASYRSSQPQQEQCRFCHMGSRMLIKGDKSTSRVFFPLPHHFFFFACRVIIIACAFPSFIFYELSFATPWGMLDLPWPGIRPIPPALGVQSLNCWTTKEVLLCIYGLTPTFLLVV